MAEWRLEHLYPAVQAIGDIDLAIETDGDALWKSELALLRALGPKTARQRAVRLEYRHAVIGLFGDVQPLRLIDRDAHGVAHRRRGHGESPEFPGRAEHLDPVSKRVGHVHQAGGSDGNSIRRAEVSRFLTATAPGTDERSVRPEFLHAIVEAIRDVDETVGIQRNPSRCVELARAAPLTAPLAAKFAIPCEDLNASIAPIDHRTAARRVPGLCPWAWKLTRRRRPHRR